MKFLFMRTLKINLLGKLKNNREEIEENSNKRNIGKICDVLGNRNETLTLNFKYVYT